MGVIIVEACETYKGNLAIASDRELLNISTGSNGNGVGFAVVG